MKTPVTEAFIYCENLELHVQKEKKSDDPVHNLCFWHPSMIFYLHVHVQLCTM